MASDKSMYRPDTRWDVHYIELNTILMTKPIAAAVKGCGGSVSGKGFKSDPTPPGFGLSRMDSMTAAFAAGDKLPPMVVKSFKDYYTIEDGRHRFACSIVAGNTHVPCYVKGST